TQLKDAGLESWSTVFTCGSDGICTPISCNAGHPCATWEICAPGQGDEHGGAARKCTADDHAPVEHASTICACPALACASHCRPDVRAPSPWRSGSPIAKIGGYED